MRMNDTVARIVDLMFENAEMTEEVAALHDEVMNNCQERFFDLVESGVAEDDAISAVVESLKGMEDVVSQYHRKSRRAAQARPAAEYAAADVSDAPAGEQHLVFTAAEIHQIDVKLVNEDVTLEASDDDDYHVIWDADDHPQISASVQGGELRVVRMPGEWSGKGGQKNNVRVRVSGNSKDTHIVVNGQEVRFDSAGHVVDDDNGSVSSIMEKMGLTIGRMFSGFRNGFSMGFGVTIRVPDCAIPHVRLLTTSGDMDVQDVALTDLSITSTSGDIDVDMDEDQALSHAEIRTISGDIEVSAHAGTMTISSTSGDVEVEGRVENLTVNTISGDIDVRADVVSMNFKAVSGDVDMEFDNDDLQTVNGSTISGDIDIDLPSGLGLMNIHTQTRAGDVTTRCHTNGCGPTVNGTVTSMSGDITIS